MQTWSIFFFVLTNWPIPTKSAISFSTSNKTFTPYFDSSFVFILIREVDSRKRDKKKHNITQLKVRKKRAKHGEENIMMKYTSKIASRLAMKTKSLVLEFVFT